MALVAISALPSSASIASADVLPAVIGSVTKKITAGNLRTQMFAFAGADPLNCGVLTAVGNATITGTLSGVSTLTCTTLSTSNFTVPTAAQPNITSLGTLSSLTVSGVTTAQGGLDVTGGSFAQGRIYRGAGGLTLTAYPSATYDFSILDTGGTAQLFIAAGTSDITIGSKLRFQTAVSKVVPGATSLSFRNNADSADNFLISDAGLATLRNQLTISTGGIVLTGSQTISINGNQVVGSRAAGWATQTTAQSRADMGGAPTAATVYQTLAALIMDLRGHGLI